MADYSSYEHLLIEINDGIALLTLNRPEVYNATNFQLHNELSRIWPDLGRDPAVKVAVVTGAGIAFSAGGDFEMIEKALGNPDVIASNMQEASAIMDDVFRRDLMEANPWLQARFERWQQVSDYYIKTINETIEAWRAHILNLKRRRGRKDGIIQRFRAIVNRYNEVFNLRWNFDGTLLQAPWSKDRLASLIVRLPMVFPKILVALTRAFSLVSDTDLYTVRDQKTIIEALILELPPVPGEGVADSIYANLIIAPEAGARTPSQLHQNQSHYSELVAQTVDAGTMALELVLQDEPPPEGNVVNDDDMDVTLPLGVDASVQVNFEDEPRLVDSYALPDLAMDKIVPSRELFEATTRSTIPVPDRLPLEARTFRSSLETTGPRLPYSSGYGPAAGNVPRLEHPSMTALPQTPEPKQPYTRTTFLTAGAQAPTAWGGPEYATAASGTGSRFQFEAPGTPPLPMARRPPSVPLQTRPQLAMTYQWPPRDGTKLQQTQITFTGTEPHREGNEPQPASVPAMRPLTVSMRRKGSTMPPSTPTARLSHPSEHQQLNEFSET